VTPYRWCAAPVTFPAVSTVYVRHTSAEGDADGASVGRLVGGGWRRGTGHFLPFFPLPLWAMHPFRIFVVKPRLVSGASPTPEERRSCSSFRSVRTASTLHAERSRNGTVPPRIEITFIVSRGGQGCRQNDVKPASAWILDGGGPFSFHRVGCVILCDIDVLMPAQSAARLADPFSRTDIPKTLL
jgi:hypothetical protein